MLELNVELLALPLYPIALVFLLQPSSYAYLFSVPALVFARQDLMDPRLSSDSLFNGDWS